MAAGRPHLAAALLEVVWKMRRVPFRHLAEDHAVVAA